MKKLLIVIMLIIVSAFSIVNTVAADEVTTIITETPTTVEPTTIGPTTEVPTTEEPTTVVGVGDAGFFDDPLVDNFAPIFQLVLQIIISIYSIVMSILFLKTKIAEVLANKKAKTAEQELSLERTRSDIILDAQILGNKILNIIVENSKISAEDKIKISKDVGEFETKFNEYRDLATQIYNVSKTDLKDIAEGLKNLSGLVIKGAEAVKTGDLSDLVEEKEA